jgi:hypothetical protein
MTQRKTRPHEHLPEGPFAGIEPSLKEVANR